MDADREPRRTTANTAQGPVLRALRRAGLVLQLLLCVSLTVWAVTAHEPVLAAIAGVLMLAASAVLALDLRRPK